MPSKWTRGKAQRPAQHDSDKPKAAKTTKGDKKPNGKKEAK